MVELEGWIAIISLTTAIISIAVAIVILYDRKHIKDGLKSTYDAKALELRKTKIAQDKLELEKRKHEAREKWKNVDVGLKLLDLIFSKDEEVMEEYEEEVEE